MSDPQDGQPPAWKQQPGEPSIRVVTKDGAIVQQAIAIGVTSAFVMRPEVAIWVGEQLIQQGNLAKTGLIIAGPQGVPGE